MVGFYRVLVSAFITLLIVGCGGAGDDYDDGDSGSTYVNIAGNANGSGIFDANSQYFGIVSGSRALYSFTHNSYVSGIYVNTSFAVLAGNQKIGSVQLAKSNQSGVRVAVLYCNNGSQMDIASSSSGWRYSC